MKKRFILLVESSTAQQNQSLVRELKNRNVNWWHWISNSWLLIDAAGVLSAEQMRDIANVCFPTANKLVLELSDDGTETWAGFGPQTVQKNMFKWINQNWR